jgi:uncharacterized protein
MVDVLFLSLGIILLVAGLLGCILPALPGPPLSFLALLSLQITRWGDFGERFLWVGAVLVLLVTLLDYVIPIWGTKKFGGSPRGVWGASIGLVVGLFLGPAGIILGPFLGALLGELSGNQNSDQAFKAALGSFLGILAGVILKLVVSGLLTWYFIKELIF